MVEHITRNDEVVGSIPTSSSMKMRIREMRLRISLILILDGGCCENGQRRGFLYTKSALRVDKSPKSDYDSVEKHSVALGHWSI